MGRKAPQDIFFPANLSEIQAVRIEILKPPQAAFAHEFLELQECGVIL